MWIVLAVTGLFFAWGLWRIVSRRRDALRLMRGVKREDIDVLVEECTAIYRDKFGKSLALTDPYGAAALFDETLKARGTRKNARYAFNRPGHLGWYVLP